MAGFTEVVAILYVICTTDIVCVSGTPSPDFNSTRIGLNTSGTIFPNPPSVLPSQANKLVPVPPPPPPSSHQQLHALEHLVSDLRDQVSHFFTAVADQDPHGSALFWNPDPRWSHNSGASEAQNGTTDGCGRSKRRSAEPTSVADPWHFGV